MQNVIKIIINTKLHELIKYYLTSENIVVKFIIILECIVN